MANIEPFSEFCAMNGASKESDPNPVSDLSGNIEDSNFLQSNSSNDQQATEILNKIKDVDMDSNVNSMNTNPKLSNEDGADINVGDKLDDNLINLNSVDQSLNVLNDAIQSHVPLQNYKRESEMNNITSLSSQQQATTTPANQSIFPTNQIQLAVTSSSSQISAAPLGSSQNPIRIIQQGNQFLSLQNLTPEQLAQVVQVVQQQQQQRNNTQSNSTVQTQNKIVYKIVYPNQSGGSSGSNLGTPKINNSAKKFNETLTNSLSNNRFISASNSDQLFHPKKKLITTEATDVLMRLNKEQKKKHRPRTRSGRVSKPPQYMVKDYKHIHPVDYDEDYDDSDGGYSDFKLSSGDEGDERETKKSYYKDTHLAFMASRSKKFKCDYCEKSYIGKGGLNRHYRLNPSHGKPDDDGMAEMGDSYYSSDSFQSGPTMANTSDVPTSFSSSFDHKPQKDIVHHDDDVTLSLEVDTNAGDCKQQGGDLYTDGSMRKGRRGRPSNANVGSSGWGGMGMAGMSSAEKKKLRLTEAAKPCTDEDILDLFIQRCSSTVSLWKILMSKTTKLYDSSIDSLVSEVSNLNEQVSTYLNEKLVAFSEEEEEDDDGDNVRSHGTKNVFEMVDEKMAACLNVPIGKYVVKVDEFFEGSVQAEEPTIYQRQNHLESTSATLTTAITSAKHKQHNTYNNSNHSINNKFYNLPHKNNVPYSKVIRQLESDIPIALPPRKRLKLTDLNQDANDFINEIKLARKVVRFDKDEDDYNNNDDEKNTALPISSLSSPGDDDDNEDISANDKADKASINNHYDDITDDSSELMVKQEGDADKEKHLSNFINIQPLNDSSNAVNNHNEETDSGIKSENNDLMAALNVDAVASETSVPATSTVITTTSQNDVDAVVANQQNLLNNKSNAETFSNMLQSGVTTSATTSPTSINTSMSSTDIKNVINNFDHKIVNSLLQQFNQQQKQQQQQQQQQDILQKQVQQTFSNNEYFSNAIFQTDNNANVAIMSNNNQLVTVAPFANVADIQIQLQQQQQLQQQIQQQQQLQQQLQQQKQIEMLMQQKQIQQQLQQQLLQQQQQTQLLQQQPQLLPQQQQPPFQLLQHQPQQQQQQHPQQICVTCYPLQEYIHLQENAQYVQTDDGMIVVKNADGTYQIYGTITQNITVDLLEGLFNNSNSNNLNNNNVLNNNNNNNNNNLSNLVNNI